MLKVSTNEDFRRLMVKIIKKGQFFLDPISELKDPYDFFQVYEKTIELASCYFNVTINDENIPFNMKFDLVIIVTELCIDDGTDGLVNRIFSIPFASDSTLLNQIKNDARVNVNVANLGCIQDRFDTAYSLLNHLYNSIETVPTQHYEMVIRNVSLLLGTLDGIIQEKLYNNNSVYINRQIIDFSLLLIQIDNPKMKETEVFKRLTVEYPEILKTYIKALQTFKRFQTRSLILV